MIGQVWVVVGGVEEGFEVDGGGQINSSFCRVVQMGGCILTPSVLNDCSLTESHLGFSNNLSSNDSPDSSPSRLGPLCNIPLYPLLDDLSKAPLLM